MSQMLTVKDLAELFQVSVTTVWRFLNAPDFPRPVNIGNRNTRWDADEIREYVAMRKKRELLRGPANEPNDVK